MREADLETSWAWRMLSVLRIVSGLVFWQHGVQKILQFPVARPGPEVMSLSWSAGMIELVLGPLLIVGLFTRPSSGLYPGRPDGLCLLDRAWVARILPLGKRRQSRHHVLHVLLCFPLSRVC